MTSQEGRDCGYAVMIIIILIGTAIVFYSIGYGVAQSETIAEEPELRTIGEHSFEVDLDTVKSGDTVFSTPNYTAEDLGWDAEGISGAFLLQNFILFRIIHDNNLTLTEESLELIAKVLESDTEGRYEILENLTAMQA